MKRKQRGVTLIGFVIMLAVVGFFIYCGMKVVPMYTEFFAVKKALKGVADDASGGILDPAALRSNFIKRISVDYVDNVKPEHFKVQRSSSGTTLNVDYEVRTPLVANFDIVGKFHASEKTSGGGTGG